MEKQTQTRKLTIEERRQLIYRHLCQASYLEANKKYAEEEKVLLKIVEMSEQVFQETFSNNDKNALIKHYIAISNFYNTIKKDTEKVLEWYSKIIQVMTPSLGKYTSDKEYQQLLNWYIKVINILMEQKKYDAIVQKGLQMKKVSNILYKQSPTTENMRMNVLSKLYLAGAYDELNHSIKSYVNYHSAIRKMNALYRETNDEGIKYDLLSIYDRVIELTKKPLLKLFHNKWIIKKSALEESQNDK